MVQVSNTLVVSPPAACNLLIVIDVATASELKPLRGDYVVATCSYLPLGLCARATQGEERKRDFAPCDNLKQLPSPIFTQQCS